MLKYMSKRHIIICVCYNYYKVIKMPIITKKGLAANKILEKEHIQIIEEMEELSAHCLEIGILNLMPKKQDTEIQLLRELSNANQKMKITFLNVASYQSKTTSPEYLKKFYSTFDEIKNKKFDGFIITGAPVEQMDFKDVDYWDELTKIMDWTKTNSKTTIYICWGAQAGLYYNYGIEKHLLPHKMFGIFEHTILDENTPIVKGLSQNFVAPHSRHTGIYEEDILKNPNLTLVSKSNDAGVFIVENKQKTQLFVTGHFEYDANTLDTEYKRDLSCGLPIQEPKNYYKGNVPVFSWKENGIKFYSNWVNEYVAK